MQVHRNRPSRRTKPVLAGFVGFLLVLAVAFGGALLWQTAQEAQARLENPSSSASAALATAPGADIPSDPGESNGLSAPVAVPDASGDETGSSEPVSFAAPDVTAGDAPDVTADGTTDAPAAPGRGLSFAANPADRAGAEPGDANFAADGDEASSNVTPGFDVEWQVPETAVKAGNEYFDDAIFFGDSISTGITAYNIANNTACVAAIGVSPQNVLTYECVLGADGRKLTLLEAAKAYGERKKVYIMLGGNGLGQEKDAFIADYQRFIDTVLERYPGATVYIQSLTPVTSFVQKKYTTVTPARVREYNEAVALLARENSLPFVNVFEALCDTDGLLPGHVSPNDGMHLSAEYYFKWFDYLKTHTVEGT